MLNIPKMLGWGGSNNDQLEKVLKSAKAQIEAGTVYRGVLTATADDATAGTISTGAIDSVALPSNITGFIVQVYRAGKLLAGYGVTATGKTLTIATNGTDYVVTAGDKAHVIVF